LQKLLKQLLLTDCSSTGSAESLAGPDFERFGDEHMLCLEDSMSEMKGAWIRPD